MIVNTFLKNFLRRDTICCKISYSEVVEVLQSVRRVNCPCGERDARVNGGVYHAVGVLRVVAVEGRAHIAVIFAKVNGLVRKLACQQPIGLLGALLI